MGICIYTPVPVVYVHGDGIYHQQETVHSPAAVAPLQPGRPSSPSRRPRGDQDHPPGRALIDPECFSRPCHPSTANWSTPLPTGEPPRQPSARTHGPPPTGESPATVAHAPPLSPLLSPPPSRPAAGALARNPPSSSANWPPLAPSRSPPIPSHPLAVARPAPAQPPYREGGSPDCPPWPTAPAPTPAPTPTPAPSRPLALSPTPCEPASRTKRPRAMVAGQRRPPPRDSATHPHTGRLVASLIDSPALIGPPSCVQMLPCPNSIPRGTFFAPNVGHPLRSTHLTVPTGQRRRQLAGSLPTGEPPSTGRRRCRLAGSLPTGQLRCPGLSRPGPGSCRPLSKTLAPRRCQLAAGLGRAEDRRGSTPSVVSASSRSPPTARARTGTSVDGEVCLHKSSQGSG